MQKLFGALPLQEIKSFFVIPAFFCHPEWNRGIPPPLSGCTNQKVDDIFGHHQLSGGEGGIRTLGTALQPYSGLANRRTRPLCDLSKLTYSVLQPYSGLANRRYLLTMYLSKLEIAQ